jgi:hypothetical protein
MDRQAVEQPVHVVGVTAIAAQQTVLAEQPQVPGLRGCLVGRCRRLVGIAQAIADTGVEQLGQLVLVETEQFQVVIHVL